MPSGSKYAVAVVVVAVVVAEVVVADSLLTVAELKMLSYSLAPGTYLSQYLGKQRHQQQQEVDCTLMSGWNRYLQQQSQPLY